MQLKFASGRITKSSLRTTAFAIFASTAGVAIGQESVTRPVVSDEVSPIEIIRPVAEDGHRGVALLRKPPGEGPFPGVVIIHGGLSKMSLDRLHAYVVDEPLPSRFLAAGYTVASITYRSRDADLESQVSRDDSIAAVRYLKNLPEVDEQSVSVFGCSGGGDLALAVAAEESVAAIVPEEPASMMFTGVWNNSWPKRGDLYTPMDSVPVYENPRQHFTEEFQRLTREKIARIQSPILILQGDQPTPLPVNDYNAAVLIPELESANKALEVNTYPGAEHCFAIRGSRPASAAQALKAFQDAETFIREHVAMQPTPMEPSQVDMLAIE